MVECGPYSDPDVGCKVERDDSLAAYGNALAWAISGKQDYAKHAISIMDAYASTIEGHNNSNARSRLAGWALSGPARERSSDTLMLGGPRTVSISLAKCSAMSICR